ncbi:hypothetical protein ACFE04_027650 [Oxalis oulophora]
MWFPDEAHQAQIKTVLSVAASLTASAILFRSLITDVIPDSVYSFLTTVSTRLSSKLTIIIDEFQGLTPNQMYIAASDYIGNMWCTSTRRIKVYKPVKERELIVTIDKNQELFDSYNGVKMKWVLSSSSIERSKNKGNELVKDEIKFFELSFNKKHRDMVLKSYLPYILRKAKQVREEKKTVMLHTVDYNGTDYWSSIKFDHPATLETIAMDPDMKADLVEDLENFTSGKEYYARVGKAWKRGYLLYGPPGTGKSSLIAAIANYLKFDIYDLDLKEIQCDSDLRRLLIGTGSRSIIAIEELDRTFDSSEEDKITLSGVLNFIDGLWSSCGDERIIICTTNHKDRIDPVLLRPGRMDVHIHMSYCTFSAFKTLAFNYLQIHSHPLFQEIEELFKQSQVTPAQVAGELMRSRDVDAALKGLIKFLENKTESETPRGNEYDGS